MKRTLTAFLLFLCAAASSYGSHLVGGEMALKHLLANNYTLSLTMYFDAANATGGTDEPELKVSIFSKSTNLLMQSVTLTKKSNNPIQYLNPQCASSGLQTNVFVYESQIVLSPTIYNSPAGYYVSWERCCRNDIISNLVQPGATGMVFYMEFPAVRVNNASFVNSSPVMNAVAGDVLCINELYTYSFAATDADGDSLAYSLITPLKGHTSTSSPFTSDLPGPYANVNWSVPHNVNNAIPGFPPLVINPLTGLLTVRPLGPGLYVFSVQCAEYRNGVKIGEVRRDFQWKVVDCPQNQPPTVQLLHPGGAVYQPTDTLVVSAAESQCYEVLFKDSINSLLSFEVVPLDFTSPVLTLSPSSGTITQSNVPVRAKLCWPDCSISRPGIYTFEIVVRDRACPQPKAARLSVMLLVRPEPNEEPTVSTSLGSQVVQYLEIGQPVNFTVTGTDPDSADVVTLSAEGVGFSLESMGMVFPGGSAPLTVTSPFTWQPDCRAVLARQPLRVIFRARDNSCFSAHQDTTSIIFFVRDIPSTIDTFKPVNIFTPNGDGLNDTFSFPLLPEDNCTIRYEKTQVFSRWGKKVFEATSRTAVWDGRGAPDGIYYYLIGFTGKVFKGTVTIIR